MFTIIVIALALASCMTSVIGDAAGNYCNLCDGHVACKNKGVFGTECSKDRAVIPLKKRQKTFILELHNRMRNKIALGHLDGYESAQRMPILQWDAELAFLAELNARSCHYGHDTCRATPKFKYAGQNIARRGNSLDYENTDKAIERMVLDWFNEYPDANMSYIDAFRLHDEGKKIGHFTVMVNERVTRIGCALVKHQLNGFKYKYFVCNYSYTNILNEAVYTTGESCTGCKSGCHRIYKGLCNEKEIVLAEPTPVYVYI